ncbi:TonB-dependent receptor [Sphingomonas sp. MG17]|uniref:TonB-dependent receptor n=1 Tax=Sphingomonas tagetis TaxID=2949092 RepID=A0A9X2HGA5_9SPHN|nr:TonB-dependent receptor [Sphingomonas tagetis]MCP3730591.1 TonB-dependent receptor [Sphingomonas tagetis]
MKSTSGKSRLAMIGVSAMALMHASAGFAQDTAGAAPAAASPAAAEADEGLGEIVVTAQKREENIRDVPISITALSADDIANSGVRNITDLTAVVPGLKMDRVGAVFLPAIRGVSTLTTTGGVEPNVATYVDNVYLGGAAGSVQNLPDISSIAVLKGPQGTLFGRNATGGAIQIFTREPDMQSVSGELSASYARFNSVTLKGFLTAPIIADKLAVSVSGYRETADSYYNNLTPNVPLIGVHNYTVRAKILATPTETTRILITGLINQQSDPSAIQYAPMLGLTVGKGIPGAIVPTRRYDVASNLPIPLLSRSKMASIEISQETSLGEITLLGAVRKNDNVLSRTTATAFAYPAPFTGVNYTISGQDAAEQVEFDFASSKFGGFSFVVGGNYYRNRSGGNPSQIVTSTPQASSAVTAYGGQTARAFAAFGEATFELTDSLSIVGGLRYSHERRGVFGAWAVGATAADAVTQYEYASKNFSSMTYKAAVRYELSPDANVYFTYSTGFRSGNFNNFDIPFGRTPAQCAAANTATPGSCPLPIAVNPEKIRAFEVGLKAAPTPWLRINGALYAYQLSDIQILSFSNVCVTAPCPPNPTTPLGRLSNAATTTMYGAEVDVDARITPELRIQAGVSLLDASFSDYPNAVWNLPAPGGLGLISTPIMSANGKQAPRAPKATLNVSATYTKDLPIGEFSLTANGYASERIYFDVGNVFYQPAYATLGLRASLSPSSLPGLTVSVWGTNLTNEAVILSTFLNANGALASYAPPRTYGATVSFKF